MLGAILLAAVTFETRSPRYLLSVENSAISAKVVVTDLDSSSRVISEELMWNPNQSSKIDRTIGDLHFKVSVTRQGDVLKTSLEVDRGEMDIDESHAMFRLAPHVIQPAGALRVGGNVHAPRIVNRVEPLYPAEARANKISGIVVVEARIDATGKVSDAMPIQGPPELFQPAVDAIKQWVFEPATLDGKPVPVIFNVTVNFKLN